MKGYNLEIHPLFWAQEVANHNMSYYPNLKRKKFISIMNKKTYTRTSLSNILLKYENNSYYNYFGKNNLKTIDKNWLNSRAYPVEYDYVDWEFGVETGGYNKKYDMYKCITEKTWRPLKLGKPFLVFGYPGMYKRLKKYGFILSNDIDYSFDNNTGNRFDLFCNEVERLVTLNDIKNIKQDALDNQTIFVNLVNNLYRFPKRKWLNLNQDHYDFIKIHKEEILRT
jgi:hypothetical protein